MNKIDIYSKESGNIIATYIKSDDNIWNRYANNKLIETTNTSDLYKNVFGSHQSQEKFFFIIETEKVEVLT